MFREGQVIPSFSIITVQKAGLKDLSDEKSFQLDEKTNILRTIDFAKRSNLSLLPGNQCPHWLQAEQTSVVCGFCC